MEMGIKNLSLRAKIILGSATTLALLVILGLFSYNGTNSLLQSNQWVDHTHEVIQEAMNIEASAVDMETGMRGYLLAGKDEFLGPYTGGDKRFNELVSSLQNTVNDNPAQVQRLNDIRDNIKAWQKDVTEPTIAMRREIGESKTMDDMRDLVRQKKGKEYMDGMRAKIATFIGRERELMAKREETAKRSSNIDELKETFKWVSHTHEVIGLANDMLSAAVDMETGMRGYLLAGIDEFLDPYKGGIENFNKGLSTLKYTVKDNPAQVELLGEIDKMHNEWQSNVTESAIALRREIGNAKSMNDMAALIGEARGKKYFDKFRGQIKTFIETEAGLMEKRQVEAHNTAARTIKIIVWGIILAVLVAITVAFFLSARSSNRSLMG
jgi:methyl-accepting chemotaxis protein